MTALLNRHDSRRRDHREGLFREFIRRFMDNHPEHDDFFRAVTEPAEFLGLINQLAAKGVFPTANGWYRNSERHLDGDFEAFKAGVR